MRSKVSQLGMDVYRDLRDRRLLVVAVALLCGMIAVPLLVKGTESVPTAGVDSGAAQEGGEVEVLDPVVLTEESQLRDYQDRLKELQSQNPFRQQLTDVAAPATEDAPTGGAGGGLPTEETATSGSTEVPLSSDEPLPGEPVPGEPIEGKPVETEPTDSGSTETTLVTTRIDVRVGPVGDTKVIRDVEYLDVLPDRRTAVLEYLQGEFDLTRASFIVSPFVITTEGDGKCAPTPKDCQFIELEVGKTHNFQYDDGERYLLTLLDVTLHEEPLTDEGTTKTAPRKDDYRATVPAGRVVGE